MNTPPPSTPAPTEGGNGTATEGGNGTATEGGNGEPSLHDSNWRKVQVSRTWVGFLVVAVGVAAIAYASYWGISNATSKDSTSIVAILSSAFTAIATTTTAYFGIRAATNTAQSVAEGKPSGGKPGKPGKPGGGAS
jgi:hypothetical protein